MQGTHIAFSQAPFEQTWPKDDCENSSGGHHVDPSLHCDALEDDNKRLAEIIKPRLKTIPKTVRGLCASKSSSFLLETTGIH